MAYIEINGITQRYGRHAVLTGVSLTADPGSCVGILGMNGSGKSTLLRVLAGDLKAEGGSFLAGGTDLMTDPSLRKELIGYVPQGTPLIEELSAYDNLRLWYRKADLEASLRDGPLSLLGIPEFLKVPVRNMSGGMKKRLSIGCAVSGNPRILLLDEPGAALDLICHETMQTYFRSFLAQEGIILLVTHDAMELQMCTSYYIMREGKLVPFTYDGNLRHLTEALSV